MFWTTADVVARSRDIADASILEWGSPVPFFGSLARSRIATVGINPSNREFVGADGDVLAGRERRLPTTYSLGISSWEDATPAHIECVLEECDGYFRRNPYDSWFRVLDSVLSGTGTSYYSDADPACHVDLVPFATTTKWGELRRDMRDRLMSASADVLGAYIRDSSVELLVLNGQSVVRQFQAMADCRLATEMIEAWTLPRRRGGGVRGIAYVGTLTTIGSVHLEREIDVVGYNHNLQSSYGVTTEVLQSITAWLADRWGDRT